MHFEVTPVSRSRHPTKVGPRGDTRGPRRRHLQLHVTPVTPVTPFLFCRSLGEVLTDSLVQTGLPPRPTRTPAG